MKDIDYETARITKVTGKCPACEDYADKKFHNPAEDRGDGL